MQVFDNNTVFCYFERTKSTMAKKVKRTVQPKKTAKTVDHDRTRSRRFLYLWLPVICITLIAFYAAAFDPSKPTGSTIQATLIGKSAAGGAQSASSIFRIKLDNGEETDVFIPEKQAPSPGSRIVVEEYTTYLLKKRSYQYLRTMN